MVITENDISAIEALKRFIYDQFRKKDLGKLKYFLGIEVAQSKQGISISQCKYTLYILDDMGMLGVSPMTFPMKQNLKFTRTDGQPLNCPSQYRKLIDHIIFLTITRPNISYSVHLLSQFMQQPRIPHLDVALHVLRYLKGTPGQGLMFLAQNNLTLSRYCDAD